MTMGAREEAADAAHGDRPGMLHIIAPFWLARGNWRGWLLLAVSLALMFGGIYIAVWSNELDGRVVDAMVERQWDGLWQVLWLSLGVSLLEVVVLVLVGYLARELLHYEWRSWMTRWYVEAWTRSRAYYEIEREGTLDNADQRIAEDVEAFVQLTHTLVLGAVRAMATTVAFTVVLWQLSGTLEFSVGGTAFAIPGYMVYIVYAYVLGSLAITHLTGRPLAGLYRRHQSVEADFRYRGMQLRENAEQVAFYDGGERERQRLLASFEDVRSNWRGIMAQTCKMMLARDIYLKTGSLWPTIAALPRYLPGAISLGDVTRITGAFNSVAGSLSFFTQAYVSYTQWLAAGRRLRDLSAAIARAERMPRGIAVAAQGPAGEITAGPIELRRPSGQRLARVAALRIGAGERWLVRGDSGAGKSTLLRALAGMWPHGRGHIVRPARAKLMFLPQRSYIPAGELKAALCYPGEPGGHSDDACRAALAAVQLAALHPLLHVADRWQQRLSGGEQQRLAIARALLQRPDFLFLDEATSALGTAAEAALYGVLRRELPQSALVSVAHRPELEPLHDHVLDVGLTHGEAGGARPAAGD